ARHPPSQRTAHQKHLDLSARARLPFASLPLIALQCSPSSSSYPLPFKLVCNRQNTGPGMRKVNIHEAKTTLSQLVEAAEAGERVGLARAGKPVAGLNRLARKYRIQLGVLKGQLPQQLLDEAAEPLSQAQLNRLFGSTIEP